jgi:hypothetical protein
MCSLYRNKYYNLKLAEATMGRGLEVKRSGRDEPIWVVIHMCMEITQRTSPYSYPYLKTSKNAMYRFCLEGSGGGGSNNIYACN